VDARWKWARCQETKQAAKIRNHCLLSIAKTISSGAYACAWAHKMQWIRVSGATGFAGAVVLGARAALSAAESRNIYRTLQPGGKAHLWFALYALTTVYYATTLLSLASSHPLIAALSDWAVILLFLDIFVLILYYIFLEAYKRFFAAPGASAA
jgi:hypothetical protein